VFSKTTNVTEVETRHHQELSTLGDYLFVRSEIVSPQDRSDVLTRGDMLLVVRALRAMTSPKGCAIGSALYTAFPANLHAVSTYHP
jgi:hypothetical protein